MILINPGVIPSDVDCVNISFCFQRKKLISREKTERKKRKEIQREKEKRPK